MKGDPDFGRRFAVAREAVGLTQQAVADYFQIKRASVAGWEGGASMPDTRKLADLGRLARRTVDWLLTGAEAGSISDAPVAIRRGDFVQIGKDDFALLPVYDMRFSAGPGSINSPESPIHEHAFRADWIRSVTTSPPSRLAIVRVTGDSMWHTLHDGDHVLIDRSLNRVSSDGIYVFRYVIDEEVRIKRIQRVRTGLLTIVSDNTAYTPDGGVNDAELEVYGRVIWLGRRLESER